MIPYECPHCQHRMELPDEFAGQRATCTRCGIPFATPEGPAEETNTNVWADVYGEQSNYGEARPESPDARPEHPEAAPPQDVPDWIEERERNTHEMLGPPFWGAAYFLPPAALVWALTLPRRHPQKKVAIILPVVWMAVLTGVGFAGVYLTPQLADAFGLDSDPAPQMQAAPAAPAPQDAPPPGSAPPRYGQPGAVDHMNLKAGEMFRVTGYPITLHYRKGGGGGTFSNLGIYELPVGGVFQVNRPESSNGQPWYEIAVTDGQQSYLMWASYKGMRTAGLESVPPPSFGNPTGPVSVPIRRKY